MELKDVFGEIQSDGADLVHGRLLEWALTPPLWHAEAVRGRPHHQARSPRFGPPRDREACPAHCPGRNSTPPPETLRPAPRQPRRAGSSTAPAAPPRTIRGRLAAREACPYRSATPDRPELNRCRSASPPARTWRRRPKSRRTGTARLRRSGPSGEGHLLGHAQA